MTSRSAFAYGSARLLTASTRLKIAVLPPIPIASANAFQLLAPRPNPSRGSSEIRFLLPSERSVEISLFDVTGRRVRSWAWGEGLPAGRHVVAWDGRDDSGALVRSGVYIVRGRAGRESNSRKLVIER